MLNSRIEIETKEMPYKVNRKRPTFLDSYFEENIQWIIFCDNLDHRLQQFQEIKAKWMCLGVVFALFLIGIVAGIVVRFVVLGENYKNDEELGLILSISLFVGLFLVFAAYFCLMQKLVIKPLDELAQSIDEYCQTRSKEWDNIEFRFERSSKCSVYWDADFDAWINVTSTEAV